MTRPADRGRTFSEYLAGQVRSDLEVFESHGLGRVRSGGVQISWVGPGHPAPVLPAKSPDVFVRVSLDSIYVQPVPSPLPPRLCRDECLNKLGNAGRVNRFTVGLQGEE